MASINFTSSTGITRNRRSNRVLRNFTDNRHFINQIQPFARRATFNDRRFSSSFSWSSTATFRLLTISLLLAVLGPRQTNCVDPKFDPSTRMRLVLVPADAQVGSVIYRLRATDEEFDYPLAFEFVGDASASASTVKIESLPCTKYNSVCQANVVLQRRLEPGRYYDFQVSVKDTKGGLATQLCSITATNFTTPHDRIFPHKPGIIMIPEDAKRGTELDYVIARKNPLFQKPVYLELWGSPLFAIRQKIISPETTEGTVFLLGPLDFEKQAMYHLTILANDAYSEPGQDSRNIAGLEIVVIVQDVQDQPPVFTLAPPVTKLPSGLLPGDKILQVHAEDGDKGNPREVRYGLVSEGNPFTSFFDINDTSGEIFLMRPLEDIAAITHVGDPVLLTVIAEEVKVGRDEPPAMASTVQLAFFLPERTNSPPYFENDHYVSRVDENAPQGTALAFQDPYVPRVYDDDSGKNGVFSLTLLSNNGTFEISPNVAERSASFLIRVRDNVLLDYEERQSVVFQILAQELGPATNLSAVVNVTVYINDVNDNPPNFQQAVYTVELPENMTVGTKVVQVQAIDGDSANLGGRVRYTAILGYLNTSLNLDAETGLITISTNKHGFDREVMPEYHLYVEARDNDGTGNRAQVPLVIKISDVNDETPTFDKDLYEFILAPNVQNFTSTAVIHAVDKDATAPNNDVRYEIINGNYENKFTLNKITGELTISEAIRFGPRNPVHGNNGSRSADYPPAATDTFTLIARAYDLGVPIRFSTTTIRIYPPESRTRTISFVVPGLNPDKTKTEETLAAITGGKVVIHDIHPLQPDEPGAKNIGFTSDGNKRSVVTATVLYDSLSVVDISQIQQRLSQQNSSYAIMMRGEVYETDTLTPLQTLYKAENKLLFWLLILLATLVALTILILALCCICSWCPLYGAASKRIVNISRTEDDVHLVHREMANGKQTKSVQVAEWMGRREAWSAEKPPDPRTKPTRWEFRDGREQPGEVVDGHHPHGDYGDRSSEEHKRRIRTNYSRIAKENTHPSFHNSRTNLINDRDVYIEDVIDERKIAKVHTEVADNFQSGHVNHQMTEQQQHQQQHNNHLEEDRQIDDDSMRRHEIDRGSDIEYNTARSSLKNKREYFIKDGNVEILQLITRDKARAGAAGEDDSIYVNVPQNATNLSHPQLLMVDNSGKEILMRRFIEEQPDGKQIIREHYQIVPGTTYLQSMPNEVLQKNPSTLKVDTFPMGKSGPNSIVYSQIEPEVRVIHTKPDDGEDTALVKTFPDQVQPSTSNQSLAHEVETSLKQQNTLLRQILMEKQKLEVRFSTQDGALETQSLPGQSIATATQTDCDAGTQTDVYPNSGFTRRTSVGSKVRRKARSENDDSMSEPDYEYVRFNAEDSPEGVYWIKRNRSKKRLKYRPGNLPGKRIVMVDEVKRKIRTPIREEGDEFSLHHNGSPPKKPIRFHCENKASKLRRLNNETKRSSGTLNRELLREITDSLDDKASPDKPRRRTIQVEQYYRNVDGEDFEQDANEYEVDHSTDIDSDTDEIVIKSHVCTPSHQEGAHRGAAQHRFEFHVKEGAVAKKSRSLLEREEQRPTAHIRLSRKNSSKKIYPKYGQSNSDPSPSAAAMAMYLSNQSDLPDETTEPGTRSVPKYMEWYYSKKKPAASSRTSTDSSRGQSTSQRQADPVAAEKRISKTRINIGDNFQKHDETKAGKYKPEPAPRKSPQKGTRFLREDIAMNKQSKKSTEAEANHPLVQHSEHRFEREHFPDVPTATSKLSHYMYPEANNAVNASKEPAIKTNKVRPKPSPIKENEIKVTNARINLYIEDPKAPPSLANSTQKLNVSTLEDDHDSGIAMNSLLNSIGKRNPIAEKKSVFSIAYDDVSRVKKINSGGGSPQYS